MDKLLGKKIAILATDGVEHSELTVPRKALEEAGAVTELVSLKEGDIKGWKNKEWRDTFPVDITVGEADSTDYDGLLIPGGTLNADKLRMDPQAVAFVNMFFVNGKPVAAICHAPWVLIEADVVKGRKMTSFPSLKKDLINAGANWVDQEVVVDNGLVTSRKPDDIPAFNEKMIEEFAESKHVAQHA